MRYFKILSRCSDSVSGEVVWNRETASRGLLAILLYGKADCFAALLIVLAMRQLVKGRPSETSSVMDRLYGACPESQREGFVRIVNDFSNYGGYGVKIEVF